MPKGSSYLLHPTTYPRASIDHYSDASKGPRRPGAPLSISDTAHVASDQPDVEEAKAKLRWADAADPDLVGDAVVRKFQHVVRAKQGKRK